MSIDLRSIIYWYNYFKSQGAQDQFYTIHFYTIHFYEMYWKELKSSYNYKIKICCKLNHLFHKCYSLKVGLYSHLLVIRFYTGFLKYEVTNPDLK